MIEEVIARECPRYVKKQIIYHGEDVQAIFDTHTNIPLPIKVFQIGDKRADAELDRMNSDYETRLRNHFKEWRV